MPRDAVEKNNILLQKKYRRIESREVRCEKYLLDDAKVAIVAYGTMSRIARGAVEALRRRGIKAGLLRPVTLWPFPGKEVADVSRRVKKMLVVEMSYGQMVEDVRLAADPRARVAFYGRSGGGVPQEKQIIRETMKLLAGTKGRKRG